MPVAVITAYGSTENAVAALKAGADGYLLKTINAEDLSDSILKVLEGESVVSPEMTSKLVAAFRGSAASQAVPTPFNVNAGEAASVPGDGLGILSAREREILTLISRGASNKVIARDLDIAETTVKIHVQHILRKLNLSSRVQAAVYAAARGVG